jgi:outer membrane immunogenic protein
MKKLLLAVALGLLASPAAAADLPAYKALPSAPAFSWTGLYLGIHGGAGFGTKSFDYRDVTPAAPFLWQSSFPVNGGLVGGQIGFNWQVNNWLLGIEAEGSWADLEGHSLCNTTIFFLNCASKTDALATATARLGFVMDRGLIFFKGGYAAAHDQLSISSVSLPPIVSNFNSSLTDWRSGWTLGMGLEYMVLPGWSAKVEYDFMDFGSRTYNFPASSALVPPATFTNWSDTQFLHVLKFGVSYHFGGGGRSF